MDQASTGIIVVVTTTMMTTTVDTKIGDSGTASCACLRNQQCTVHTVTVTWLGCSSGFAPDTVVETGRAWQGLKAWLSVADCSGNFCFTLAVAPWL